MISLEKWMILAPLQKLPKNVGDLGKLIVAKGFKSCPKYKNRQLWSHCSVVTYLTFPLDQLMSVKHVLSHTVGNSSSCKH